MINPTIRGFGKFIAAVALLASAQGLRADTVTLDVNAYTDGYGGGEFTALNSGLSTAGYASTAVMSGGFETFCLAYNEEFYANQTYTYNLGSAVQVNSGGTIPISVATAYLYSQFAQGTLSGYDYSTTGAGGQFSSRLAAATELQLALWWAEGEQTGEVNNQGAPGAGSLAGGNDGYDSTNYFENLVVGLFGISGSLSGAAPGTDNVDLLIVDNNNPNLGTTPYAQPQLYYNVPDNGTTALLLGVGLVGLAAFRRRVKVGA